VHDRARAIVACANARATRSRRPGATAGAGARSRRPGLDGDPTFAAPAAAPESSFQPAEEELVDLDLVLERLALWGDHRPAQLRKLSHAVS
jgi:hypothetical protein